jgi:hypothetical protein
MPYIKQEDRGQYDATVNSIVHSLALQNRDDIGGHINYIISSLASKLVSTLGERYATYEKIVGSLECAKLELYRKKIAPYEEQAIKKNGDLI